MNLYQFETNILNNIKSKAYEEFDILNNNIHNENINNITNICLSLYYQNPNLFNSLFKLIISNDLNTLEGLILFNNFINNFNKTYYTLIINRAIKKYFIDNNINIKEILDNNLLIFKNDISIYNLVTCTENNLNVLKQDEIILFINKLIDQNIKGLNFGNSSR